MLKRILPIVSIVYLALPSAALHAAEKGKIAKCQDATGRWHYGDTAAAACAKSHVTVIDKQGYTRKEIAAPPTEEELKRREANREEEERKAKTAEERKRKDELLLATYGHEQDIIFVRDRKLAQIESSIKATESTVSNLRKALERLEAQAADEAKKGEVSAQSQNAVDQTKKQIEKHEAVIMSKRQEQEQIRKEAEDDLRRYREIKGGKAGGAKDGSAAAR